MIRILFIGDIVGRSGRSVVKAQLENIKTQYKPDFIIANGENAAHGKGITPKIFHELLSLGINVVTMGNHTYAKNNIYDIIEDPQLVRPLNLLPNDCGEGVRYFQVKGETIGVINVIGEVFMERDVTNPYQSIDGILRPGVNYIVDFHGEATSEKAIFTYHYQQELCAVIGTHTHIQTADERLINGCAFISDVGMCAAYDSILGRDLNEVLRNTILKEKTTYQTAEGPGIFCGVIIDIEHRRAIDIQRIQIRPDE
ncbi:MAG: TIGR00282 family metallophosphoesterase [Erysipelotrichaceae bacterium]|nr:TIGR00282 family metallophosphoesterase [Erysipelotrichaceae bacterium]